jgi:tetratricopeptide (TPR) repeat protein
MNTKLIVIIAIAFIALSCADKENKQATFLEQGKQKYEQSDFENALKDFDHALEIDSRYADAYYWRGLTRLKLNKQNLAQEDFQKAVELNPNHNNAQLKLASILIVKKEPEKALTSIDNVLDNEPDNVDALLLQAAAFSLQGKLQKAKEILFAIQKKDNSLEGLYLLLSKIALQEKNYKEAESILNQGLIYIPDSLILNERLFDLYKRDKQYEQAEIQIKQMIQLKPNDFPYSLLLADLYQATERAAEAEQLLRSFSDENHGQEERVQAMLALSKLYLANKRYDEAGIELNKILKLAPDNLDAQLALAEYYFATDDDKSALKTLRGVIKQADSEPPALKADLLLASYYYRQGQVDKAIGMTDEIIFNHPEMIDAHFIKGQILLKQGAYQLAQQEFTFVANRQPDNLDALMNLGLALQESGQLQKAKETYLNLHKARPNLDEPRKRLVHVYLQERNYAEAYPHIDALIKNNPNDKEMLLALGQLYSQTKEIKEGRELYSQFIELFPDDPHGYLGMGQIYQIEGNMTDAINYYRKALSVDSDFMEPLNEIVALKLSEKQYEEALEICRQYLPLAANKAYIYNVMGEVSAAVDKNDDALQYFMDAAKLKPDWEVPFVNYGHVQIKKNNLKSAESVFKTALKINPQNPMSAFQLGWLNTQFKQFKDAKSHYEKALEIQPDFLPALNNLAFLLMERPDSDKDLDKAITLAKQAATIEVDNPNILDTLGWAYYKKGDYKQAKEHIERAIGLSPDNPVFHYHLGMVSYRLGDFQSAKKQLTTALVGVEAFSGRTEATETLAELKKK